MVVAQQPKDTLLSIHYTSNEWKLKRPQLDILKKILPSIKAIKKIEAFADSIGLLDNNFLLSKKRGEEVLHFFKNNNIVIPESIVFFGEKHINYFPFSYNRRVDIYCTIQQLDNNLPNKSVDEHLYHLKVDSNTLVKQDSIVLNLDYIYFVPDKAFVVPNSIKYLESLADLLKKYNAKSIEIIGHSNKGDAYYTSLSERRAKTIYDYLILQNIDKKLLSYIGVGNKNLIYQHPKLEEEMRKNMRVEIVLKF